MTTKAGEELHRADHGDPCPFRSCALGPAIEAIEAEAVAAERERCIDIAAVGYHGSGEVDGCDDPWGLDPEIAWCDVCRGEIEEGFADGSKWASARQARAYRIRLNATLGDAP